jgi:hypothetical protein
VSQSQSAPRIHTAVEKGRRKSWIVEVRSPNPASVTHLLSAPLESVCCQRLTSCTGNWEQTLTWSYCMMRNTHTCICVCTYASMYMYICTHCVHRHMQCICVHTCTMCTRTCVHTFTCAYIHTYVHTHILGRMLKHLAQRRWSINGSCYSFRTD